MSAGVERLRSGDAGDIAVERLNNVGVYLIISVIVVIVVVAAIVLAAQNKKYEAKAAERKPSVDAQPWYQNRTTVVPTPNPTPMLLPEAVSVQKPVVESDFNSRIREEEYAAMKAGTMVSLPNKGFEGRLRANGSEGCAGSGCVDSKPLAGESKKQEVDQNKEFLDAQSRDDSSDYLLESLKEPLSPYEVKAGTVIPAALITGINSELPGQITAQVRENVYDTVSGAYLLVPQGARLIGAYESHIAWGQTRVLVAWKRIIFPDGRSIRLRGMPGVDSEGYAGFNDQVNNHYLRLFGAAVMLSVISAGAQLSQPEGSYYGENSTQEIMAGALGQNLSQVGTQLMQREMNVSPTLEIRPGFLFNVMVTQDIVLPGVYE